MKGFRKVYLKAGESRRISITLDNKAYRYFNTDTGRFEMETAHYLISVGASVSDIRLSTTLRLIGTNAAVPSNTAPSYTICRIKDVSDGEFAALLGHPLPEQAENRDIQINDPISSFRYARSALARWLYRFVRRRADKQTGKPDITYVFILDMPIRAMSQMTGGRISREMTEDIVFLVNGHTWRGIWRLIKGYFRGRKVARAFDKELQFGPRE